MDIVVSESTYFQGRFIVVSRTLRENDVEWTNLERMPRETLAIRAAEYDLEPEDDFVLDLVMLERFVPVTWDTTDVHPLFSADTVKDALEIMRDRVESARVEHGSPRGRNRMLAAAVRNGVASDGLVAAHRLCMDSADPRVVRPIRYMRDRERERLRGVEQVGQDELGTGLTRHVAGQYDGRPQPTSLVTDS
jgi:hypothetical protein